MYAVQWFHRIYYPSSLDVTRVDLYDAPVAPLGGGVVAHVVRVDVPEQDEALHVVGEVAEQRLQERHRLHGALLWIDDSKRIRYFLYLYSLSQCFVTVLAESCKGLLGQ